jgi:hypothetical protein
VEFPAASIGSIAGRYIRSMVLGYKDLQGNLYPFCDFIFEGTNGIFPNQGLNLSTGNLNYYDYNLYEGYYNVLNPYDQLSLSFSQSFSSPCSSNVLGC